ncbi:hypothetical protein ACSSVW_000685 [Pseudoalteromonas sp. MBR-15]
MNEYVELIVKVSKLIINLKNAISIFLTCVFYVFLSKYLPIFLLELEISIDENLQKTILLLLSISLGVALTELIYFCVKAVNWCTNYFKTLNRTKRINENKILKEKERVEKLNDSLASVIFDFSEDTISALAEACASKLSAVHYNEVIKLLYNSNYILKLHPLEGSTFLYTINPEVRETTEGFLNYHYDKAINMYKENPDLNELLSHFEEGKDISNILINSRLFDDVYLGTTPELFTVQRGKHRNYLISFASSYTHKRLEEINNKNYFHLIDVDQAQVRLIMPGK